MYTFQIHGNVWIELPSGTVVNISAVMIILRRQDLVYIPESTENSRYSEFATSINYDVTFVTGDNIRLSEDDGLALITYVFGERNDSAE